MADELSRRELLKSTAVWAILGPGAAAGVPIPAAAPGRDEIISTLSTYMAEAGNRKLPEEALEKTKQIILDTFAAMISGADLPPGKFAIQFARSYKGERIATVAASNVLCGPIEAALANGML